MKKAFILGIEMYIEKQANKTQSNPKKMPGDLGNVVNQAKIKKVNEPQLPNQTIKDTYTYKGLDYLARTPERIQASFQSPSYKQTAEDDSQIPFLGRMLGVDKIQEDAKNMIKGYEKQVQDFSKQMKQMMMMNIASPFASQILFGMGGLLGPRVPQAPRMPVGGSYAQSQMYARQPGRLYNYQNA